MKSVLFIGSMILSSLAWADSATFQVKGMHCGSCASAVESHVCKMPGVTACKVEVTDPKKEMGKVTLTTDATHPIDSVMVEKQVSAAGDYHVVKSAASKK